MPSPPATASLLITCLALLMPGTSRADQDFGLIKTAKSPYARLRSVNLASVRWTEGFWADRFRQTCEVTLPRLWELAADPKAGHALENLKIAAGLAEGEFVGTNWQDEWVYKWLEAAAYVYSATRDAELDRRMDEVISIIAKAQQPDGYLATQVILRPGWNRFEENRRHELYVMGHLITAACAHHRITGKSNFLDVAVRTANYLHRTFCGGDPLLANCPLNPSIIMAAVELYRTTGEKRYLDLANTFINNRGSQLEGRAIRNSNGILLGGSELNQDRVPLRQETQVIGHAVFFTYLYAGATDAYLETGDPKLVEALQRLWVDLTERKMYITGGVSAIHAAHPARSRQPGTMNLFSTDSVHEAAGMPYELPNATAYNETCGQIGNLMWNWRMLAATGEARFADIMEQTLYNSILSGINVNGRGWSYTNPLRWHGPDHVLLSQDEHQRFDPGAKHICCPSNLLRLLASWHGYLYSTDDSGLWVHHYGGNTFSGQLGDGRRLKLVQHTDYPWDGRVRLTLEEVAAGSPLSIRLRVPRWANDARITVNGQPAGDALRPGSYAAIERRWQPGDVIELNLPMPVRMLAADPRVAENRNHAAVMRGPVVYCLESVDLPAEVLFEDVHLPRDAQWTSCHDPALLGGVTVLETEAAVLADATAETGLYRELRAAEPRRIPIQLIPYYAWNNRGEPEMAVWLPLD